MVQSIYDPKAHTQVCGVCGGVEFTATKVEPRNGVVLVTACCCGCGEENIMSGTEALT